MIRHFIAVPIIILSVVIFSNQGVFAQWGIHDTLDASMLNDDLDELISTLEASHPDLYAFTDSATWNQAVAQAYKGIENGDTYAGFSRKISQLLGSLKDSHTVLNFSDLLDYQIGELQHILPMKIFSDSTGMYVREDMTGLIPAGAEIVSVNGVSAEELTQGLRDFSCAEGFSPVGTTRVADAIFYEVAGLLLPISRYNSVVICRTDSAESDTINYKALNDKEFDVMREVYFMDPRKQINRDFYLKIDRKLGLGILKVGSFAPPDNKKYTRFLERSFEMLSDEQIPNVVIDLRGNMGGSSANVEELTSYLIEDGYNTPSNIIARQSDLARSRSNRFVMAFSRFIMRTFYRGNEDLQAYLDAMSLDNGEQDTLYFHEPLVQKKDLVFKGNKFLMINGLTASAGVDMTHAFKKHRIGTIVGEPCLGPITGTFGNPAGYTLPNTGITLFISTIRYNYDNNFRYDLPSIEPDIWVVETPEDIRSKKDVVLDKVKSLLPLQQAE